MGHPNDGYIDPAGATTGPPVPPSVDLEELERQQSREQSTPDGEGGAGGGQGTGETGDAREQDAPADYSDTKAYTPEDLEKLASDRELEVTGTGANGNVLRADLEKALADDDAAKAASQS